MICDSKYTPSGFSQSRSIIECIRDGGHIGNHNGWEEFEETTHIKPITKEEVVIPAWRRHWSWSGSGGGAGTARGSEHLVHACTQCGSGHSGAGEQCFTCQFWNLRSREYGNPKAAFFRPHGDVGVMGGRWLYHWSDTSGAFGDRRYVVHADDGRVLGPASNLWGNGEIPWWRVSEFPPNCRIVPAK